MWWRANDVLVGAITGAISAVIAVALEVFFIAQQMVTLGHAGGGFGSKVLFIAIVGGIAGAIIGFFIGAVVRPRSQV